MGFDFDASLGGGLAESLTVRVTVNVPGEAKAWLTVCPEPAGVPSPNAQLNVYDGVPPVALPVNVTV